MGRAINRQPATTVLTEHTHDTHPKTMNILQVKSGSTRQESPLSQHNLPANANVTEVHGPLEAMTRLSRERFDAILLDISQSSNADITIAESLAAADYRTPVIVLAAEDDSTLAVEALQRGAQDFLISGELSAAGLERAILFAIERKKQEHTRPLTQEQIEVENHLRQTEEQYRAIFAATSDGLVINDYEGRVVEVNPAFCNMHGYTREEMLNLSPPEFIHPNSHSLLQEFFETVRAGGRFRCEAMDVRKDGSSFHVEVHGISFMFRGEPHILGLVRDITERVETETLIRTKEQQYRAVFEASTDGLAVADLNANVVEVNPAWCKMHGYTREEMLALPPTAYVHPDSLPMLAAYYEKVRAGERFQCEAKDVRKDGTAFDVEVQESPILYNGELHTLTVLRDITERVRAFELMEQRVEERTRELKTLLDVSANVASTLELQPLLSRILDQLKLVADYKRGTIAIEDPAGVMVLNSWGDPSIQKPPPGRAVPVTTFGPIGESLRRGTPVIIPDVLEDTPYGEIVRNAIDWALKSEAGKTEDTLEDRLLAERSIMYVPLMLKDNLYGGFTLRHAEPNYYTERHAELAMAIANQAVIAVENARLYAQAQETARKTAALAQTASQVAFGGNLQATLDILCRHVVDVTAAVASAVVLRDVETGQDRMVGTHCLPEGYADALNAIMGSGVKLLMDGAFSGRHATARRNMRQEIRNSQAYAPLHHLMDDVDWDTVVAVPMMYRERPVGVLLSYHLPNSDIGEAEMTFHSVIADQASVAVENARLFAQAHDKARLEERQRLARELHDSVTQALFSISLIARSAEITMQREGTYSTQTMEKMSDLRQLTQGALAEMRALIFELRPGALEEEGLYEALRKHAAAVQGREMVSVDVLGAPAGTLPRLKPVAEEALYRVAQEALHNVVKHARASKIEMEIDAAGNNIMLRITDNGVGFDPALVPAGHMGLGTMGGRVKELGGEYRIESSPGAGTTILAKVPLDEWRLDQ